jgi:hypothetical protein
LTLNTVQHNELLERISQLERSLSDLEGKVSANIDVGEESSDSQQDAVAVSNSTVNTNVTGLALSTNNKNDEHTQDLAGGTSHQGKAQKRLQQQAILRALSQKMELAALSGL